MKAANTAGKSEFTFTLEFSQGHTCSGQEVVDNIEMKVELDDDEVARVRQLVGQTDKASLGKGLMPILEKGDPKLHKRLSDAARSAIFDFLVIDGIYNDLFEFDEEDYRRNYENDRKNGEEGLEDMWDNDSEEDDDVAFFNWQRREQLRLRHADIEWIRSRYPVEEHVYIDDTDLYYICHIPTAFLP